MTIARRPNDNMSVFVRSSSTREALMVELSPWGFVVKDWRSLGQKLLGTPSGYWRSDGSSLDVYGVGDDYNVWRARGYTNGVGFAWERLGAAGYAPLLAAPTTVAGDPPALAEDPLVPQIGADGSDAMPIPAAAPAATDPPVPSGSLPPL